jgi:hypothetical protein
MKKTTNAPAFNTKIKPMLAGYLKTFGDTKFAGVAQAAVDAYGEALARGGH